MEIKALCVGSGKFFVEADVLRFRQLAWDSRLPHAGIVLMRE